MRDPNEEKNTGTLNGAAWGARRLTLVALVLGMVAAAQAEPTAPYPKEILNRPNIIFLLTDDQRAGTFGAAGHPELETPHLDRLLERSVRFRNAYTVVPICSPSRISYFTGTRQRVHGVGFTSAYQLTEEQWARSYPALLRDSGYYTGFVGKFGVEYYDFRGQADEKFDYWWGHDGWTRFFPKLQDVASTLPYHRAENDIITPIMGEAMREFLDTSPLDKPFCLSVSFNVPHGSQARSMDTETERLGWASMDRPANANPLLQGTRFYDTLYRDRELEIPAATGSDPYAHIPRSILDHADGRDDTYSYNYSEGTNREHHVRYLQMITGLDAVIGDLVAELERRGLMGNTVILFGSDHGLLMGEYGMGGKSLLYDLSAKIPCFLYHPDLPEETRGSVSDALVSSLDVTATILDAAGIAPTEFMEGESLLPLAFGTESPWRSSLFLESFYTGRGNPVQEAVRTERWKYIRMFKVSGVTDDAAIDFEDRSPDFEQLFDLRNDPGETVNLVEQKEGTELLSCLRREAALSSRFYAERRLRYKSNVRTAKR